MILGVEHIALSCENVDNSSEVLRKSGYDVTFVEKDVPNNKAKESFLKLYTPVHSIGYCGEKHF